MEIADPNAKLEGTDVLFTGKEFFVGISQFTNEAGARAVAKAFPEFPCVPIRVSPASWWTQRPCLAKPPSSSTPPVLFDVLNPHFLSGR